ncbi:biopolymer transporter ExbD [bacterium]|nr:MAG: biopolymer transporter ExbD [bacterium]
MKKTRNIKKPDIRIDMTPMVDVIMLLLTFFMLTATFRAAESEAIQVALPQSVYSDPDNKMRESNVMTILLTKEGNIYLDVDNYKIRETIFKDPLAIGLYRPSDTTGNSLKSITTVGDKEVKRPIVGMSKAAFEKTLDDLKKALRNVTNDAKAEFQVVVKGDRDTEYGVVEDLMNSLHESNNKIFSLVTMIKAEKKD